MEILQNSTWTEQVLRAQGDTRLELIETRPIVVWFSNRKKSVQRLVKISGHIGQNLWMIQGRASEINRDLDTTPAPTTLEKALKYLTAENGWVLCEFFDEESYCRAFLNYLEE